VPKTHSQWNYFLERISIKKKSRSIRYNYKDTFCFAVAGTHETTTSKVLGHILFESGVDVTAFIGG
jgi:UDP-N-acetylmuramate--alanine ligase